MINIKNVTKLAKLVMVLMIILAFYVIIVMVIIIKKKMKVKFVIQILILKLDII